MERTNGELPMPKEDRRIIFDHAETYKAIYAFCIHKEQRKPPPGNIVKLVINPEDDTRVLVRIENRQDGSSAGLEYSRDFLAAALMLYCRSLNIPIAKKSQKSVDVKEDSVILRLVI